jgi:hypothetical protein
MRVSVLVRYAICVVVFAQILVGVINGRKRAGNHEK